MNHDRYSKQKVGGKGETGHSSYFTDFNSVNAVRQLQCMYALVHCKVTVTLVKATRNGDGIGRNMATSSTPRQSERHSSDFIRR